MKFTDAQTAHKFVPIAGGLARCAECLEMADSPIHCDVDDDVIDRLFGMPDPADDERAEREFIQRSAISGAVAYLAREQWFIAENTPYGVGLCAPAREDVLSLIETLEI